MATASRRHLGIDLGGTNCKWVVLEQSDDDWTVLDRGQVMTAAADGPDAVIGRFVDIGRAARERWPELCTIGIGVPGLYDPLTGDARFLVNFPGGWRGVPIGPPVCDALGVPTALINDARAFGLAELRLGAGRGASSMVGMVLGTGVGGVIAIDGKVHLGHDGTAGELGHQTIDPDGPSCNCGNHGCLEAFARADRIAEACGTPTVEAAVIAAHEGDARARAGLTRVGTYLGIGIANLIAIVSPDRVVVGGGVAAADALLLDPMRAEIARRVTTTALTEVDIVTAELGTWAGAIGAGVHGADAAP
jgi:glucokinase